MKTLIVIVLALLLSLTFAVPLQAQDDFEVWFVNYTHYHLTFYVRVSEGNVLQIPMDPSEPMSLSALRACAAQGNPPPGVTVKHLPPGQYDALLTVTTPKGEAPYNSGTLTLSEEMFEKYPHLKLGNRILLMNFGHLLKEQEVKRD